MVNRGAGEVQIPLELFRAGEHDFDAFHAGANVGVIAALRRWVCGDGPPVIYLWGPQGAGKTHLVEAALGEAAERGARAIYLPLDELVAADVAVLDDLASLDIVALDDIDAAAGKALWERGLFNLYNALQEHGGRLLWTSRRPPLEALFELPDLASRLAAGLNLPVTELDDAGKTSLLQDAARRRGLEMPAAVAGFILRRQRRDTGSLISVLEELDRASLSHARALTVPFVRKVLGES